MKKYIIIVSRIPETLHSVYCIQYTHTGIESRGNSTYFNNTRRNNNILRRLSFLTYSYIIFVSTMFIVCNNKYQNYRISIKKNNNNKKHNLNQTIITTSKFIWITIHYTKCLFYQYGVVIRTKCLHPPML